MSELSHLRVLITAGANGIGRAVAARFQQSGAQVHVGDIDCQALQRLREQLPSVGITSADVASEADVGRLFQEAIAQLGGLDVLVNNAGIAGPTAAVEATQLSEWQRTLDVNLTGTFLCTRQAVPWLKQAGGGVIINMGSVASRLGFPHRSAYSATKWALLGLTETWAMELGPAGIRVNAVLPGIVAGPRQEQVLAARAELEQRSIDAVRQQRLSTVSLRSMVTAEQIADTVAFLCSPAGSMISGQSLSVCGNVETLR